MRRRTYLLSTLGLVAGFAGCDGTDATEENSRSPIESRLSVTNITVTKFKPKDYEERPEVAETLQVKVENSGDDTTTVDGVRITGDIPAPHDESDPGAYSVPSQGAMDKVKLEPGDEGEFYIESKPLYYVNLSSEGDRTQEDLDTSTCRGETRNATLHFETEDHGTIDRDIQLQFGGDSVEFDEMAPDYGCTNVTVVNSGS